MEKVWIYLLAASSDPNFIKCAVPYKVDNSLIFFGPCKKRMREQFHDELIKNNSNYLQINEQIFIIGVNGGMMIYADKAGYLEIAYLLKRVGAKDGVLDHV